MRKVLRNSGLGGLLSLWLGQTALGCAFHGYTPDPTLVDVLYATEHAVFARLDPSDRNRYVPVETIVGPEASSIPIAVNAGTRAQLLDAASQTVLLARDGAYGPWLELAVLDGRFQDVVIHVLAQQSHWLWGGEAARAQHFASLVNDPNPDLRQLALQELDRVPYATLQALDRPELIGLRHALETIDDDLAPIRVLLAGLSKDRGFSPHLQAELDKAVANEVPYLGAYATALVELEGDAAVHVVLDRYLTAPGLSPDTQQKLLEALAIQHKTAPSATRRVITRGIVDLLRHKPELRDSVAGQFGIRRNWLAVAPLESVDAAADEVQDPN